MHKRNFLLLLSGQLVSQVGDKIHMLALSFWVLKTTGSTTKMGAVLAASLIPSLVTGLFSGAFIDRYDRKKIIIGTDLLRGLILAWFAVLFYFDLTRFYAILIMQVLLSFNAAFFDPAIPSVIAQMVDRKELAAANSKHQFVCSISTIAGACIGGMLVSMLGYGWVFAANAVSFLVSALCECFITIPPVRRTPQEGKDATGIMSDLAVGYRYILSRGELLILLLMVMVIHFFVGTMEIFMPVLANAISADGARNLGFFQASFGLGAVVMAAVLSVRHVTGREAGALFGSVFVMGALFVATSISVGASAATLGLCVALIFLFGGCIICAGISFKTLLQLKTDNRFAGRVFAVVGSVANASIPGAMITYGFLLENVDLQDLMMISGMALMPLSVISSFLYRETQHVHKAETGTNPLA